MGGGKAGVSQEIDQRVVEMRFDNAQFEKNSRDTMRTLDKLKEKLSFKGAAKGLEQVEWQISATHL
jgi:hypothetical protein